MRAGSVSLELVNFGMDIHDLVVKSTKVGVEADPVQAADPRGRAEKTLRLTAGPLRAVVLAPGPQGEGMHATLVVRK